MSAKRTLLTALSGVEDKGIFGLKVLHFLGKQLLLASLLVATFHLTNTALSGTPDAALFQYVLGTLFPEEMMERRCDGSGFRQTTIR